jgi:hypothetical protein
MNAPGDDAPTPATGSNDPQASELAPEEEPVVTGTLFLTMIILMLIGAVWGVAYYLLVSR